MNFNYRLQIKTLLILLSFLLAFMPYYDSNSFHINFLAVKSTIEQSTQSYINTTSRNLFLQ